MTLRRETVPDGHVWFRIAQATWADPLDASWAGATGGRWNPPASFPTLYVNEDRTTARANMQLFAARWPYEPEDLRPDAAPVLVSLTLPRGQEVADVHTPEGVAAARLPATYPLDSRGAVVEHTRCQPVGVEAHEAGLRGVRCRAARLPLGAGRELAWFPATVRSRAKEIDREPFDRWFWQ
ncbi:MAG: RES family NAD+ phosphorylase [Acidimicrobiales bacterium]